MLTATNHETNTAKTDFSPNPSSAVEGSAASQTEANPLWSTLATRSGNLNGAGPSIQRLCAGCEEEQHDLPIQAKLIVGAPDDQYEREADDVAQRVMRIPEPEEDERLKVQTAGNPAAVQRMNHGNKAELQRQPVEQEEETLQTKRTSGNQSGTISVSAATASNMHSLRGGGRPLSKPEKSFFEPRFGADFSGVRVHEGARAADLAQSVNARAFTLGNDVVFGRGEYGTDSVAGKELLAHELVHVVQQQSAFRFQVQRFPDSPGISQWQETFMSPPVWEESPPIDITSPSVQAYLQQLSRKELLEMLNWVREPKVRWYIQQLAVPQKVERIGMGVSPNKTNLDKLAQPKVWGDYWGAKVLEAFATSIVTPVGNRFKNNFHERDVVLAALWQVQPSQVLHPKTKRVAVMVAASGKTGPKKPVLVHYRFEFGPTTSGKKASLEIHFEREVPHGQYYHAIPGYGYESFGPSKRSPDVEVNFPEGGSKKYWGKRKQERKKLFYWIEKRMSGDIDEQEVMVDGVAYKVTARKNEKGGLTFLDIEWLGRGFRQRLTPRLDPEKSDFIDLQLEKLQAPDNKGGPLGDLILMGVPEDEVFSVKYAIWQNFSAGLRNREIDIVIPIALKKRRVFYTLRFRPNNDVDVERLKEEGSSSAFLPDKISIQRAYGYPAEKNIVTAHIAWLKKRYKALAATGSTPQELRENADKELERRAKTKEWLRNNYQMYVLDAKAADNRLRNVHKIPSPARADLKEFSGQELTLIEQGLQPMSDTFVKRLRYVRLARQKDYLQADGTPFPEDRQAGAQTLIKGSNYTIRFFDRWQPSHETFLGGALGVSPGRTGLVIHEFGHVIESKMGLRKAFNALVKEQGAAPFTDYAALKPDTELFAEGLMIYETDPEWLRGNHPAIFAWIDKHGGK